MSQFQQGNSAASKNDITHVGLVEYYVTDIKAARRFYVDALGLQENDSISSSRSIYMKGYAERCSYSFALHERRDPGLHIVGFNMARPGTRFLKEAYGERVFTATKNRCYVQDVSGIPLLFYFDDRPKDTKHSWKLQQFDAHKGATIMRLDHINVMVPDVKAASDWWINTLGFYVTEYTVMDETDNRLWAIWLTRKQSVHDIAFTNGIGPRLHHAAFYVSSKEDILRICDILSAMGMHDCIERGPGRHGISNAFFLYLRDPDGNRIELFTGDYMIPDLENWNPVEWHFDDPKRATFWGEFAPSSWFDEAMLVRYIVNNSFMPVREPILAKHPRSISE